MYLCVDSVHNGPNKETYILQNVIREHIEEVSKDKNAPKTAKTLITLFIETLLINCFFVTTDVFIIANGLVSLIFSLVNISILDMLS